MLPGFNPIAQILTIELDISLKFDKNSQSDFTLDYMRVELALRRYADSSHLSVLL